MNGEIWAHIVQIFYQFPADLTLDSALRLEMDTHLCSYIEKKRLFSEYLLNGERTPDNPDTVLFGQIKSSTDIRLDFLFFLNILSQTAQAVSSSNTQNQSGQTDGENSQTQKSESKSSNEEESNWKSAYSFHLVSVQYDAGGKKQNKRK